MIGILFFGFNALYFFGAYKLSKYVRKRWDSRVWGISIFILLFFIAYGRTFFEMALASHYCKPENQSVEFDYSEDLPLYSIDLRENCNGRCMDALVNYPIKVVRLKTFGRVLSNDVQDEYNSFLQLMPVGSTECQDPRLQVLIEDYQINVHDYDLGNQCLAGLFFPKDEELPSEFQFLETDFIADETFFWRFFGVDRKTNEYTTFSGVLTNISTKYDSTSNLTVFHGIMGFLRLLPNRRKTHSLCTYRNYFWSERFPELNIVVGEN